MNEKKNICNYLLLVIAILSISCSGNVEKCADVCLDAGHGGEDFGDVCGRLYEKDEALKITLALA